MRSHFCLTTLLVAALPVLAATVQVEVQDGAGKPVPDAVVYLESKDAAAATKPLQGAEVAQAARQFDPQVRVVTVGTAVQFPNHDSVRHQVYSFSDTKRFELKLYAGTTASPVLFDKPGIAVLGCNIHDNMVAWVIVVPTPYFGRSGPDGKLSLDNLPSGTYRLRTWHTRLPVGTPALDQALLVPATGATVAVRMAGLAP
ncbi:methylamine utilization protein [Rhodoferax sp. WC2427]|uniref:methylamine utilization protein n=1 Tax=Rhodoferax sp. WC2427 TaxID=3234144 RepID=UPI003464EEA5